MAVKTLRQDLDLTNQQEFMREAEVMMKLKHNCIVQFIGICMTPTVLMVKLLLLLLIYLLFAENCWIILIRKYIYIYSYRN